MSHGQQRLAGLWGDTSTARQAKRGASSDPDAEEKNQVAEQEGQPKEDQKEDPKDDPQEEI